MALLLSGLGSAVPAVAATGSSSATVGWPQGYDTNTFSVYLQEGESVRAWMQDVIHYHSTTITAPDGTTTVGTTGDILIGSASGATLAGVWTVQFERIGEDPGQPSIASGQHGRYDWSIDVYDGLGATGSEITGRMWTPQYTTVHSGVFSEALRAWIVNDTGYLYRLTITQYNGMNSRIYANSLGLTDADCTPARSSWTAAGDPSYQMRPECGETYRLFYDEPDYDVLPETWTSPVTGETEFILPGEFSLAEIGDTDLTYVQDGFAGEGTFTYQIDSRFSGSFQLLIDTDGDGVFANDCTAGTASSVDRCETLGASGAAGTDGDGDGRTDYTYRFNGLDNRGDAVSPSTAISAQMKFDTVGEVHLVQADVEGRDGVEIIQVNEDGTLGDDTIYWDDTPFADSATDGSRGSVTPVLDGTAGVSSTGGVHGWEFGGNANNPWGNDRMIDDWTYQPDSYVTPSIRFERSAAGLLKTSDVETSADIDGNPLPGDVVTYTLTVTNTGTVAWNPLSAPTLVDDMSDVVDDGEVLVDRITATIGGVATTAPTWDADTSVLTWKGALAGGQSAVITVPVRLTTSADQDRDVANTAWMVPSGQATGQTPDCDDASVLAQCVQFDLPALSITKTATADGVDLAAGDEVPLGGRITYQVEVTNAGATAYRADAPASFTDDLSGVLDQATMVGSPSASSGSVAFDPGAQELTWAGPLAAGEVATITYTVEYQGAGDGTMVNTVCLDDQHAAVGEPCAQVQVPGADAAFATLTKSAEITTDQGTAGVADRGDVVTYSFVVENAGAVTLTDVFVQDEMIAAQVGADALKAACYAATLAPGETLECAVEYTVTAADIAKDGDTLVNVATAAATPPEDVPFEEPTDDAVVDKALGTSSIEIVKDADPDAGLSLGDQVQYGFVVTNTGHVDLTEVTVTDPMVGNVTCEAASLAPGASTSCKADATYQVTEADLLAGQVENTATATGTAPDESTTQDEGSKTVATATPVAGLDLVKHADLVVDDGQTGLADAGDQIRFWFEVTNTGDVTVENVTITDGMLEGLGLDITCDPASLAPQASATCAVSGDYTVTEADVMAGVVRNTATADGDVPEGVDPIDPPEASATTPTIAAEPGLSITKSAELVDADGDDKADVGEQVQYTFVVENTGNVTVDEITVTDPMLAGVGTEVTCEVDTLAPGASTSCRAQDLYTVTDADVVAGVVHNVATATGTAPDGGDVIGEDSEDVPTVEASAALDVVKTASVADVNDNGIADEGEEITYAFTVTNTGTLTLTDLSLVDEMLETAGVEVSCEATTLAPGASTACSVSGPYSVTAADAAAGQVRNTATGTAKDPDGADVADEGSVTTPVWSFAPALSVEKVATPVDADDNGVVDPGEQITYSFQVTNSGNVPLTGLAIADSLLEGLGIDVVCEAVDLAVGGSTTCAASGPYIVTEADVLAGVVHNEATGTAVDPDGGAVSDTDEVDVTPAAAESAVELVKTATAVDTDGDGVLGVGEQVVYAFTVTNTGNVTLTGVEIVDSLLDEAGVDVTCDVVDLAPGGVATCAASGPYAVTDADVLAGVVHNEATVTATDPAGEDVTDGAVADVPTVAASAGVEVVKDAALADGNGNAVADLGETVLYTFTVTNTGTITLTDVRVDDPMLADLGVDVTCEATTLAPGASTTCTAGDVYSVTEADVLAGVVHNTVTATGTPAGGGEGVTDEGEKDVTTAPAGAGIEVVKTATLADTNTNEVADLGEQITYSFAVTNTGNVTLTDVSVADPMLAAAGVDVVCDPDILAPGESVVCTASGPYGVAEADLLAGVVHNAATATGIDPSGTGVSDDGEADVMTGAPVPGVSVVKSSTLADANGNGLGDLGERITYSFVVENTGNVTLTGVTVDDPMLAAAGIAVSCDPAPLAPGGSVTCVASDAYTIAEADVLAGGVHNVATVTGSTPPGGGEPPVDEDDDDVPSVGPVPGIEVVKTASLADTDGNGLGDLGEAITYSFEVRNTGNVTLTDVRVDDPMLAAAGITVSCDPTPLAPGASVSCVASGAYTVTEADVLAGQVRNVATATGTPPEGVEPPSDGDETTTGTPVAGPSLLLVKSADLADADANGRADLGEEITYSFEVTNNGNVTVSDLVVDDPMLAAAGITVSCDPTRLAPGDIVVCAASRAYTVTEADVLAGQVANHATVTGEDPTGEPVMDEDEKNVPSTGPVPGVEVVKSSELADANDNALADAGEEVTYSFAVTNTGNVTLTDVVVDDPMLAAAGITVTCGPAPLAPGDTVTCAASGVYTVTEADVLAGSVYNVAAVTGTTPPGGGEPPTDEDENEVPSVDPVPGIEVVKTASLADADDNALADLGEQILYSFEVRNTGNVTLTGVTVDDPMLAAAGITVTCDPATLAPGQSATCEASAPYVVTEADVLAGSVHNTATATGVPPGDLTSPSDEDDTTTGTPVPAPSLLLDKVSDLADVNGNGTADAGEEVFYSFVVLNNGNVTVTDVVVDDPMLDELGITVTCDPATLAPGDTVTCAASGVYTVTEADVLAGKVVNQATVTGSGPGGETPADEDGDEVLTSDPVPGISVVKSSELADVNGNGVADLGEQITYSFEVTNTGNVTLTDVTVDDPKLAAIGVEVSCEPGTLAPGESVTCEASGVYAVIEADILAGAVVNHATVSGTTPPGGGEPPTDEDGDEVPTPDPAPGQDLVKSSKLNDTNNNGSADLGETISYGFTVTNTGNVTITDVSIVDQKLVDAGVGVTCAATSVAPGGSVSCKADTDYVVTEADILAGSVHNVATATGKDPGGEVVDPPTDETEDPTPDPAPGLGLVKHADLADANSNGRADLGESISFWFEVSNTGNVTITGISVDDPMLTALGVTVVCEVTDLAPGVATRCEASAPYVVTEADILAGSVHNVATAGGTGPDGEEIDPPTDGTETPTPGQDGRLTLDKHADLADTNANGLADVGEQITYSFTVRNVGNVTISDIAIDDEMLATAGVEVTCEERSLAPGQSVTCTAAAPYTVTDADVVAGTVHNQATATGSDPGGEPIDPPTGETETPTPQSDASLVLEKVSTLVDTNANGLADPDEQVTYAFVVTNNGTVTVSDITVDDPKLAGLGIAVTCDPTVLAPGSSVRCAASGPYTVTEADIVAGGVLNHATVTGSGPGEETPTDEDGDEVPTPDPAPALSLEKSSTLADANGNALADPGEQVTYQFVVTNTGNVTITDVAVADEKLAAVGIEVVCETTTLAPGESVTCTASEAYTVTEADVIAGMVVNHATVTGTDPDGETPSDEDSDEVPTPEPVTGLALVKRDDLVDANGNALADVGEQITYTFEVTNTGNITVTDVTVEDPKLTEAGITVTCDPATLAPGESVTCTAPAYTVTQADVATGGVVNAATATGTTPDGVDRPSAEDTVTTKTGPKYTSGVLSAGTGPLSALAVTGATVQTAALAALALLGLGILLVTRTRRTGQEE